MYLQVSKADFIIQHQVRPSVKQYLLFRLDCCNFYKDRWDSWMKAK